MTQIEQDRRLLSQVSSKSMGKVPFGFCIVLASAYLTFLTFDGSPTSAFLAASIVPAMFMGILCYMRIDPLVREVRRLRDELDRLRNELDHLSQSKETAS